MRIDLDYNINNMETRVDNKYKAFTSLEQSCKLAEILPIESADMVYVHTIDLEGDEHYNIDFRNNQPLFEDDISAWSLAALLGVLPILDNRSPVMSKTFDGKYRVVYHSTAYEKAILTSDYDNPVDACVAMIEKLHELKML